MDNAGVEGHDSHCVYPIQNLNPPQLDTKNVSKSSDTEQDERTIVDEDILTIHAMSRIMIRLGSDSCPDF